MTMDAKVAESLDVLLKWVESAGDFAVQQAPLVAQDMIQWAYTLAVIWCVVALVVTILVVTLVWLLAGRVDDDGLEGLALFLGVCVIALWVVALVHLAYAIKAMIAPRLFVIEKISGMM